MSVVIDVFGGDNAPDAPIEGAARAAREGVDVLLAGDTEQIKTCLKNYEYPAERVNILHAEQIITNYESPTKAVKEKPNSSLMVGLRAVGGGVGGAFLSAGNTGALMAGALRVMGRISGVHRPALAAFMPCENGVYLLVDAGANTSCKPEMLGQFAVMGQVYISKVIGVEKPRVGLLNIGGEEGKGSDLTKAAYAVLKELPINFAGNTEARELAHGAVDVVVCDGFSGNILLKYAEGLGGVLYKDIKMMFSKNIFTKAAALMVGSGLRAFKKKMDYAEYGGAPLLGVDGIVIKTHGSSGALAFYHAIMKAEEFVRTGALEVIKDIVGFRPE